MTWNDLLQWAGAILVVVGAILPLVNPPGDAPLFLRMTAGCDEATRSDLARRIGIYSFGLLLGSMLIGPLVLRVLPLQGRGTRPYKRSWLSESQPSSPENRTGSISAMVSLPS
jgi:hypothetical protein